MPPIEQGSSFASSLKERLLALIPVRKRFDPSTISDPIAQQIAWTPAKPGGASFRTHKLVEIDANRLEFKPTVGARLFYLVFIVAGTIAVVAFATKHMASLLTSFSFSNILPIFFGFIFVAAGGFMWYFGTAPIVFDKYKECFWKGRKGPDEVANTNELKNFASLPDIYALQIISELCTAKDSSYYSYELNLVLTNGRRINVVDHGNIKCLREDAQTLSQFLGKPLWDAVL